MDSKKTDHTTSQHVSGLVQRTLISFSVFKDLPNKTYTIISLSFVI